MSEDLYAEIAVLREELKKSESVAAGLRLSLANATCDALVAAHKRGDDLQDRVDALKAVLNDIVEITDSEVTDTDDLLGQVEKIAKRAKATLA